MSDLMKVGAVCAGIGAVSFGVWFYLSRETCYIRKNGDRVAMPHIEHLNSMAASDIPILLIRLFFIEFSVEEVRDMKIEDMISEKSGAKLMIRVYDFFEYVKSYVTNGGRNRLKMVIDLFVRNIYATFVSFVVLTKVCSAYEKIGDGSLRMAESNFSYRFVEKLWNNDVINLEEMLLNPKVYQDNDPDIIRPLMNTIMSSQFGQTVKSTYPKKFI